MDIMQCLQQINPNVGWSVNANDYNQITCSDATVSIPTLSQLESAWVEIQKEQMKKQFTEFVQSILDAEALKHNYDNIVSATSYAGYVNQFQAEGIAFGVWRSAVWAKCYEIMADVLDGKRQVPTEEQLLSELPKLTL